MVMHEVHECVDGRIAQHRMLNWILVLFYTVSSNEKDGVSDCRILGGMVYSMSMEWISAKASLLSCVFAAIVNKASSAGNTGDSQRSKGVFWRVKKQYDYVDQ